MDNIFIVPVLIGTTPLLALFLLLFLRKQQIKEYIFCLKEAKAVINGRWIKTATMGLQYVLLEGEYQGRQVRCGVTCGGNGVVGGVEAFLLVKPHKEFPKRIFLWDYPHPSNDTTLKDGWIEMRRGCYLPSWKTFFESSQFINTLEKLADVCEKIESGEIRLK